MDQVDIRYLKSGKIRLRFKLSEDGLIAVRQAFDMTECNYDNTALSIVCGNYISFPPKNLTLDGDAVGKKRLLVNVHADEYELIELALMQTRKEFESDAAALAFMSLWFIELENQSNRQ